VWLVAGVAFTAFSLNIFFLNWLPSFLVDRLAVSLALGGGFAALFPAVGVLGRGSSGLLSDRLFGGRRRPVVLGSFLIILPFVIVFVFVRSATPLLIAIVVIGFVTQVGGALLYTYVRELVALNVVSTALAVLNTVGFLGAFVTPLVSGLLFEWSGSHLPVFGYAILLALIGGTLSYAAPEPD
jgi:sugar phosphate permease